MNYLEQYKRVAKKSKLGSGARFKALSAKLSHQKGVTNPGGLAAYLGRKAHGDKMMAKWAKVGKDTGKK